MTTQQRNSEMVNLLSADFQGRYEPQFSLAQSAATLMTLPGLRGYWPMSAFDSSGNALDQSGNGRTLTYNGNPTYTYSGLFPQIILDGTGDYLSRADEAGLDITGTESYVIGAARGLTMGGWFRADALTGNHYLMSKWTTTGNQRAYSMLFATDLLTAAVSVDGSATTSVSTASGSIVTDTFYHCVMRFDPSTNLDVFLNGEKTTNTTSIPASIFNSSAGFLIGSANAGSLLLTGRASLCFLCAMQLSDAQIGNMWQQQRALFGM